MEKCKVRDGERIDAILKVLTLCVEKLENEQKALRLNVIQTHQREYLEEQKCLYKQNFSEDNRGNNGF